MASAFSAPLRVFRTGSGVVLAVCSWWHVTVAGCGGAVEPAKSENDGGALDASMADGGGTDAADASTCAPYAGSVPVCAHFTQLCATCPPDTWSGGRSPCFAAECEAEESIHSMAYEQAYVACIHCFKNPDGDPCIMNYLLNHAAPEHTALIGRYCAQCDAADAGGCAKDFIWATVFEFREDFMSPIGDQCLPKDGGTGCDLGSFLMCAARVAKSRQSASVDCDSGLH